MKLHPACYGAALYILVAVGRLPEIFPHLKVLGLGKVSLALALLGVALYKKETKPRKVFNTKIGKLIVYLCVVAMISVLLSVWKTESYNVFIHNFLPTILVFYLVLKTTRTSLEVRWYIGSMIISSALLSTLTLMQNWVGRLHIGGTYDPNDLGMVLVTILPFIYYRATIEKGVGKIILAGCGFLAIITIIFTGSRGGFIGLAAVVGLIIINSYPKKGSKKRASFSISKVALIFVICTAFIILTPTDRLKRLDSLFNLEQDYNVTASGGRLAIWSRGLKMMALYPLGAGLGAFPVAEGRLGGRFQTAHNSLIQIGGELGVIGLLLFLLLYRRAFMTLREIENTGSLELELKVYTTSLKIAFIGFFITSFFLSQAYAPIFYFLIAMSTAIQIISKEVNE